MEKMLPVWTAKQEEIARQVCYDDQNGWHQNFTGGNDANYEASEPMFFGGTDISFSTDDDQHAVATLTVVRLDTGGTTDLVYSQSRAVRVETEYVAGFLAFREAPIVTSLLNTVESRVRERIDCLLLDGNGVLHPRKAGFACHVGVEHNLPTIGVSKSLLCVDGLDVVSLRATVASSPDRHNGVDVVGSSGFVWASALLTGNATNKPIYISVGHKVSLKTAARAVKTLCTFRIPDPIRYADMHSRAFLRGQHQFIYKRHLF